MRVHTFEPRQFTRFPREITPPIRALATDLVPGQSLRFVRLQPAPDAEANECFKVTKRQIDEYGGMEVLGWRILEWPGILIEAELHSIWRSPEGALLDVSLSPSGEERCLFLPDPTQRFDGQWVDNVRRPLGYDRAVAEYIALAEENIAIQRRYQRADGALREEDFSPRDLRRLKYVQSRKAGIEHSLRVRSTGRNDPCWCGSGRKLKRCHS